ncbi:class I SAM-dependent methyltransferase [Tropicimonas sp. TH_r6]|uniref:class I SAM-dependent DNA methyltransferase n=1 Tax=Tropicimonas sp. TH_r6 TaxID=3082085 RepID=UPI002953357B|nr:class I SAM-dependent methyltransferase [Tropicimonas sp. TH_r6]MDV7143771.1 class I SAM-dependent methyltransferase [Tropicimonas sp. TH_r6]
MADRKTISLYDGQAEDYAKMIDSGWPYPRLERFIDSLPEGGHALDLGCGPGNWAARMVERGLEVDALDASKGMAAVARERYRLDVRVAGFDAVEGEAIYDGIWAHYSLLHAPRAAMPGHLAALSRALRPGGHFLIAMKLGTGEARDRRNRFYTYYEEDELAGLVEAVGLMIFDREYGAEIGFDGSPHDFIILHARRA